MKYTHLLLIFAFACRNADVKDEEADVAVDADGDGFSSAEDCNDTDSTTYPDAEEICDGVDNNCDGDIDESVLLSFYVDADGDGFGSENTVLEACEVIEGFVENSDDCDDTRAEIHPDADEICDGLDNNCNGDTDEGLLQTYYVDADNDGFGNPELEVESCEAEQGLSLLDGDCDDQNDDIHPDGIEMCDEVDNNCDGTIDEGVTATFYVDFDGDGHGDENQSIEACSAPEGHVTVAGDCNDIEYYVNPQMIEYCDTVDNDCDGDIDESGAIGETTFYADQDEDGFGDPEDTVLSCSQPPQYTTDNSDCDDNDNDVHPGADEYCNGDDADCDGLTYENDSVDATTYYADQDEDGFGDANNTTLSCALPPQYTTDSSDCDDNDNDAYPG
ncbi:MAG: putative metal-binding motif-containing protein, partial [Myxococcota bacterium]|nr:putative metal-binding motif-containing protein [Myxococcota bacterium]